jgi:hypothetical protein
MSTVDFVRDHAHLSTNGLAFAPRIAASISAWPRCRNVCSPTASTNTPHATPYSFESNRLTVIPASSMRRAIAADGP